jgi:hypothetical protein
MSDTASLIDRLTTHRLLGDLPQQELEWLVEHGDLLSLGAGEWFKRKGDPLYIFHDKCPFINSL